MKVLVIYNFLMVYSVSGKIFIDTVAHTWEYLNSVYTNASSMFSNINTFGAALGGVYLVVEHHFELCQYMVIFNNFFFFV